MAAKNKAVEPEETATLDNHATVVAQAERKSVVFLGPHHRYARWVVDRTPARRKGQKSISRLKAETHLRRHRLVLSSLASRLARLWRKNTGS